MGEAPPCIVVLWRMVHLLAIFSLLAPSQSSIALAAKSTPPVKSAYYYYGAAPAAADVDATPLTHILYAFAQMDSGTYYVSPQVDDGGAIVSFVSTIRKNNTAIKTLLCIGGGGSNATDFSLMASTRKNRHAFILHSIATARSYGFDGLDLDWRFPNSDADMANLALLLAEWRAAVTLETPHNTLLLTAAVNYNVTVRQGGAGTYPVKAMASNLDWINIRSYDLHGDWENTQTGEPTAVYDYTAEQTSTIDYGIKHWLSAGLPPYRAVLGLANYGYLWYLKDPNIHGVGAPTTEAAFVYSYSDIEGQAKIYNGTCTDDAITKSAYCYWRTSSGKTLWAGFDDTATIAAKVLYLKSKQLRGFFMWSVVGGKNALLLNRASKTLTGKT